MKPAPFKYHAPASRSGVLDLLRQYGDEARPLAGGQSLVPMLNFRIARPSVIIDLGGCDDLSGINDDGDAVVIRAMARQSEAAASELVRRCCPLLAEAIPYIGTVSTRNRGTICGSLAHADVLAELPCVATALDATFSIRSATQTRTVPASEFFLGPLTTSLGPDELLEAVRFPKAPPNVLASFDEIGKRRHGFAVAGLAIQVETNADGLLSNPRLCTFGLADAPTRLFAAEDLLAGRQLTARVIQEAASIALDGVEPRSDMHASAAYRIGVARALVERSLAALLERRGPTS